MTTAASDARTLTLVRLERAAGLAFGCEQDKPSAPNVALIGPTTIALATLAVAVAATLTYLI